MKRLFFFIIFIFFIVGVYAQSYLKYSRVKSAYNEKEGYLSQLLQEKDINSFDIDIIIVGYKATRELIVWVKGKNKEKYDSLTSYDFCMLSGDLGPKRQLGDCQVPEGFYKISLFNPWSSFELSLKVSYPNKSDIILSTAKNVGNDIYIHGGCASIGCIPITDDKIKELYLLACFAKESGQYYIPVYLFPTRLNDNNFKKLKKDKDYLKNIKFWSNLKQGYDIFVNNKKELNYSINQNGEYIFDKSD